MSGVVSFFWLDSDGDARYARIPRDEVRAIRFDGSSVEIQLAGAYQDINIEVDPSDDADKDIKRKLSVKMIDSIRSGTDEDVFWEWDGDRWDSKSAKSRDVWRST